MKKLILALAFISSLSQMTVAQEIETTLSDTDLTEIQQNVCSVSLTSISDETALGNPLATNNLGQYTYTKTETYYVSDDDDDDDDDDDGFYTTRTVTVTVDAVEVDSTIQDNLSNPSAQEEVTNICL
ncbi:MAG: hypothetical protein QNJ70_06300 [Xenococcaceae cyanobacterium MO_207.B15]|nr:hypothetical protein [Xenococcaceae cyanobacterium MO_207.B15]